MTSIISEGKTTTEAIENGLKQLKVSKKDVNIKVLEEDKRSFFSILAPRVVKVEIISKKQKRAERVKKDKENIENIDFDKAKENVNNFLKDWVKTIPSDNVSYNISQEDVYLKVDIDGGDLNYLIGYRGDVLNNLQYILSAIASKGLEYKVRVILNICGYKEKREKALIELAEKLEKTVVRTKKEITLEPMTAYERKIIHSKLQNSKKVTTTSIGEEPFRRLVITLK